MALNKSTVKKVWLTWLFNNQACYNYERMMGLGFVHAISVALKEWHGPKSEKNKEVLDRQASFFNCEPCLGSSIVGLTLAMEEQKEEGAELDSDAIVSIKTGLMGPISGIGDTLMQGVLVPLIMAFAIDLSKGGNWSIPVLYCVIISALVLSISWFCFSLGYKKGSDAILELLESGKIKRLISVAGIMGCMVIGALVVNFVHMSCGITIAQGGKDVFSIQEKLFDAILPSMLPLLLTLGCYKLLKSGKSSVLVMLLIILVGVIGGLTGILSA